MGQVVATTTNVLILSSMYILVALGFAFLFSMLGLLNFAHGAIYMIGGYIGYEIAVRIGLNPWTALCLATLIVAAFGAFLEKFCFRPFLGDFNRIVMVCVAITILLQTLINILEGGEVQTLPVFVGGIFRVGRFSVSYQRMVTFAIGAGLLGIASWFVSRTKWGQQMQAIAQNMEAALLQGINVHRISMFAFALGCGLATIAGCLMGAYLQLSPFMGDLMLIKALILVILAGVGSIGGIFLTGLLLGGLDAVLPILIRGAFSDAIAIIIVVILLLFRPEGFFGHEA
jgi:branched-subunit amino acid ABC-type transport system permease component